MTCVWLRQLPIDFVACDDEPFLGPIGDSALLPFFHILIRNALQQVLCYAFRVGSKKKDELGVPIMMQVAGFDPWCRDALVVAAPVMVIRRMQREMQVTNEMQKKF